MEENFEQNNEVNSEISNSTNKSNSDEIKKPTLEKVFNIADGCIIGSALKVDGNTWNPVDPDRAKSFMELVKKIR